MVRIVYARVVIETVTLPDGSSETSYLMAAHDDVDEEFVLEINGVPWATRCVVESWPGLILKGDYKEILEAASDIGIEDGIIAFEGPRWRTCEVYVRDPDLLAALRMVV